MIYLLVTIIIEWLISESTYRYLKKTKEPATKQNKQGLRYNNIPGWLMLLNLIHLFLSTFIYFIFHFHFRASGFAGRKRKGGGKGGFRIVRECENARPAHNFGIKILKATLS